MQHPYDRVRRAFEKQQGLVTRRQALAAGLTGHEIRGLVRDRLWLPVPHRHGVFRLAGVPVTYDQAVMAACLAAGAPVYAAQLTAGRVHGLRTPEPSGIDLLTSGGRRLRQRGMVQHRTDTLARADTTRVRGIPVTSVARTILDVSGALSPARLEAVTSDAVRRKLVRMDQLRATHARLAKGRGRRSHRNLAALLARRPDDWNPGDSDREVWVFDTLVAAGLEAPVQHHRVVVGGRTYYLDFAYPAIMLAVEFDGFADHGTEEAFHYDRARWRRLVQAGWTIVLVTSRTSEAELVEAVAAHLDRDRCNRAS